MSGDQEGIYKGSVVKVEKTKDGFELHYNGAPYFIQGAGAEQVGDDQLQKLLKGAGGNSLRTWDPYIKSAALKKADANKLTVTLGIRLYHKDQMDYGNPILVQQQLDDALQAVKDYKDYPALLIWGLGNELEGGDTQHDDRVWKAVNEIAKQVKAVDPNHPTMTVVPDIDSHIAMVLKHCPAIDILGVNSFRRLTNLPPRLKQLGLNRPYVVTEFGPPSHGGVRRTAWKAPVEPTSTEKAQRYADNFKQGVAAERGNMCLGAYAFLWGHKQEGTATWYGMFLPHDSPIERLGVVDTMTKAWNGPAPANRAPEIQQLNVNVAERAVPAGFPLKASVTAVDPDGDLLDYLWQLYREADGGSQLVFQATGDQLNYHVPLRLGNYRLFVIVHDGHGNGATGNVPFQVN